MFHFIHRNVKKLFYEVARGFKSFVLVLSGKAGIFLKMVRTKVLWYILTLCLLRVIRTFISPKHFGTLSKRNWTRIQKNFQIGYFFRIQHQIPRPSKPCLRMHCCGLNFQEFLERGYWIDMWSLSSLLISHIGSLWSSNLKGTIFTELNKFVGRVAVSQKWQFNVASVHFQPSRYHCFFQNGC